MRRDRMRRSLAATVVACTVTLLTGCGSPGHDITGVWQADDGSGLKTVNRDGSCTGMYYNNGRPLDIGGAMTCVLGDKEQDGEYLLIVRQPPNERTYRVRFDGGDSVVLMDSSGNEIVVLSRQ